MKMKKQGSWVHGFMGSWEDRRLMIPAFLLTVCSLLLTFNFQLSFAEGLSDIKTDALQAAAREKWGRDPFVRYEDRIIRESSLKEEVPPDLKVDGIISDGKKAMAIINGGFYRKSERVNDFLIVAINKDIILLEKNGRRFYLGIEKFAVEGPRIGGKK